MFAFGVIALIIGLIVEFFQGIQADYYCIKKDRERLEQKRKESERRDGNKT